MQSYMNSCDQTLKFVISEFPEYESMITQLYQESSNFIEICEDYQLCQISVQLVNSTKEPGYENQLLLMKEALSELKEELVSKLKQK